MASGGMTMAEAIRVKLESTKGPVEPSDLHAHIERDAVFLVRPDVDLIECGVAVALDDVATVKAWIDSGALRKPSAKERVDLARDGADRFTAIVVQPFVLLQAQLS